MDKLYFDLVGVSIEEREIETRSGGEANPTPVVTGYASVFNTDSAYVLREKVEDGTTKSFVERIGPTAFDRSLDDIAAGRRSVKALWEHDHKSHLGSTQGGKLSLEKDERGLKITLDATRLTPAQIDTIRDGDAGMSFGFIPITSSWGRRSDGLAVRTVTDLRLNEVTFTTTPVYAATEAAIRSLEEFEADEARQTEELEQGASEIKQNNDWTIEARRKLIGLTERKYRRSSDPNA